MSSEPDYVIELGIFSILAEDVFKIHHFHLTFKSPFDL